MRLIAAVRLARVALHLLRGLVVSLIVMPHATHALRDAIRLRWSKKLLRILGVNLTHEGQSMAASLIVANHISWLDVFVIHAVTPAVFVCKAEVKHWPLIGPLVRACGTLFIERGKNRAAATAAQAITQLLNQGRSVAIFPEGTTSDGRSVLPFRSALIESSIHGGDSLQPPRAGLCRRHHALAIAMRHRQRARLDRHRAIPARRRHRSRRPRPAGRTRPQPHQSPPAARTPHGN